MAYATGKSAGALMQNRPKIRPVAMILSMLALIACSLPLNAQKMPQQNEPPRSGPKATLVREANLYVQPSETSDRVSIVTPGREMIISERSGHWIRVFANIDAPESRQADMPVLDQQNTEVVPVSGWMLDKGVIAVDTPRGDAILFGEAISAEDAASEPHPPPRSAIDARLLYRRIYEMYPDSKLAPEAMWRAADIRWQLQKADAAQLPSAHEKENYLRQQMDEDEMKKIIKYFPRTKWADLAAYDMIENQLCGDWQGSEKCPEKEADDYARYGDEHPDSIRTPEAYYKAAWRLASAGDMWQADGNESRAKDDRKRAEEVAGHLLDKYQSSQYAARAASLIYKMQQGIAIYGSDRD